jgi:hypothetical protein
MVDRVGWFLPRPSRTARDLARAASIERARRSGDDDDDDAPFQSG